MDALKTPLKSLEKCSNLKCRTENLVLSETMKSLQIKKRDSLICYTSKFTIKTSHRVS